MTQKELSPVLKVKEEPTIEDIGEDLCELVELTESEDENSDIDYRTPELSLDERIHDVSILDGNLSKIKGRKRSYQSDMTNEHSNCEKEVRCKSSDKTNIEESDREWPKEVELDRKIYRRMMAVYVNEETGFRYIIKTGRPDPCPSWSRWEAVLGPNFQNERRKVENNN